MDDPTVLVLLLEQGDRSLEDHTEDFVILANYMSYPDSCLCSFYITGLNTSTREQLSGDGPREIERASPHSSSGCWCPASRNSPWTSWMLTPVPLGTQSPVIHHPAARRCPSPPQTESQSLPRSLTHRHQERQSCRSSPRHNCPTRCESRQFKQMWKQLWRSQGIHGTTAGGEHKLDLGDLIDFHSDTLIIHRSSELYAWEYIPPNLPLPPPLIDLAPVSTPSSLDSVSLSAHPQLTICGVGSPLVCRSPALLALSLEDPSTPPSASEAQTPPQSCDPAAPPRLPAPSSPPEPISPPAPPGSLVPPAPPWSVVPLPPPRDYTPPATLCPSGSVGLLLPPPQLHLSPLSLRLGRGIPEPRLHLGRQSLRLCLGPPELRPHPGSWLSVASSGSTTCSAAVGRPHGVGAPSSIMAPPSVGSSMGHHRDCGLGPTGLPCSKPLLPPLWLLPPSDPPWTRLVVLCSNLLQ